MTTDTVPAAVPSVFDAGLPSLDYLQAHDPEDAHRAIADARRQAPMPRDVRRVRLGRTHVGDDHSSANL